MATCIIISLSFIRTVCVFDCITCKNMQNIENLDIFEILTTQNQLKCPKDPFVRFTLNLLLPAIYFQYFYEKEKLRKRNPSKNIHLDILYIVLAVRKNVDEANAMAICYGKI